MKDEHNIILILDSPKWLIPYSGGSSNSWFQLFHLLFCPEFPTFFNYISTEIHLNHCKASTLSFSSSISFDHSFTGVFTKARHGDSSLNFVHFQFLRWFVQEFSSLVIISIHSFFPILTADRWRLFSSLRYVSLNPFYRNK